MGVNRRMRVLRQRLGLSQERAARRAGISLNMWARVELGKCEPSLRVARRIAEVLDATLDELFAKRSKTTDSESCQNA